jgi:hypothetical protein
MLSKTVHKAKEYLYSILVYAMLCIFQGKDDPMAIGTIVGIVVGCAIAVGGLFALAFLIRYMWYI